MITVKGKGGRQSAAPLQDAADADIRLRSTVLLQVVVIVCLTVIIGCGSSVDGPTKVAYAACEAAVRQLLQATGSTQVDVDAFRMVADSDQVKRFSGSVEMQNSGGAPLRMAWSCTATPSGATWTAEAKVTE